jgi:L-glyceraldehyde 3-phosphate reductase
VKKESVPNTDLVVSSICLGTMTFGTPVAESDAIEITHWAIDRGINFIDTANIYEGYTRYMGSPGGVSESILGKALKGKRDRVVLATKVGMKVGPNDDDQGLGRSHVLREIDRSLQRLQSDYVDVYYMHKADENTPLDESVQVFNELIDTGKVRYWAISNFSVQQIQALLCVCDENGWRRPVMLQPSYSLLKRDIEQDVLPLCRQEELAVVPYQVLQGGLLTGKYHRGEPVPAGSRQKEKPEWTMALDEDLFDRLEALEAQAGQKGRTLMQHALLSLLDSPAVVSLVLGVKNISQLETLVGAVE